MPPVAHVDFPADGVGIVLIDNPPMNFGTWELMERVDEAIQKVKASEAKVVILASDVPGYFIGHGSLVDIIASREGGKLSGDFMAWARCGRELRLGPMVSIACNHGQAWGGGSELSWTCDLRTAGESATYGQPEAILGIVAGGGGTSRLPRILGEARAKEMLLDAGPVSASTALTWGLVNRVFPDATLREETITWAAKIATRPAWSLQASKKALGVGLELTFRDALTKEQEIFRALSEGHEAETLALLKAAQAKYDAGDDSYQAWGLEADRNNPTDLF